MPERALPEPEDGHDRDVLGLIARHGWAVLGITDGDEEEGEGTSGYSFSVGLYHTLGGPELLVMGLRPETAKSLLNAAGDRLRAGERFAPGDRVADLAAGYPTAVVGVAPRYYPEYVGYARWLYRGSDFPMLQLVWPDKAGLFPWEDGYDADFFALQRVLGATDRWPHGWPFPDPPNVATFTTRQVVRKGRPVVHVYHDAEDGAWQFHGPDEWDEEDMMIVGLEPMLALDPSLADLGNLPAGWRAYRDGPGAAWGRMEAD
jgi:hypothetical protein